MYFTTKSDCPVALGKDPITLNEALDLLGHSSSRKERQRFAAALTHLKRSHHLKIKHTKERGKAVKYQLEPPTQTLYFRKAEFKRRDQIMDAVTAAPPVCKAPVCKAPVYKPLKPDPLDDACMHLIQAYDNRSISTLNIADFFNITEEAASCMLMRLSKRFRTIDLHMTVTYNKGVE